MNSAIADLIQFAPGDDRVAERVGSELGIPELPALRAAFNRDGFVVVPDVFAAGELDQLRRAVEKAVGARKARFGLHRMPAAERSAYESQFTQCLNLWEDFEEMRAFTFHPRLTAIAAALLGAEGLRVFQDQALVKPPGGNPTAAHQDHPLWAIEGPARSITGWVPLMPGGSTLLGGALGYVPGSHKAPVPPRFANIATGEKADFAARDTELLALFAGSCGPPSFVEVPEGGVAFHHGMTVHFSKPNLSGEERPAWSAAFMEDGAKRGSILNLKRQAHPIVDRPGCEVGVGAVLDSPLTPVAYPRAANAALPPRPPSLTEEAFLQSRGTMPAPPELLQDGSKNSNSRL